MTSDMKILRKSELRSKTGLSSASIDRQEEAADFPKRLQIGPRAVGWLEEEVDAWIAARVAARDGVAIPGATSGSDPK
jgi:prophage regulatory protein